MLNDWLSQHDELGKTQTGDHDGFMSRTENEKALGLSKSGVMARLRLAQEAGLLEVRRFPAMSVDNLLRPVSMYRVKPKEQS